MALQAMPVIMKDCGFRIVVDEPAGDVTANCTVCISIMAEVLQLSAPTPLYCQAFRG